MNYFDYCANTPASRHVLNTFVEVESTFIANANSNHQEGLRSKRKMDEALSSIASMIGVEKEELIITSGATEANNLAIKGIAASSRHVGKHILSTSLEHTSVSASLTYLQQIGYEIDLVPIKKDGTIDLEEMEDLIREDTCLVAVSAVDSEIGVQQPLKEIERIVRQYPQCRLHIDATQAVGKIPVDFSIGDTISFAPHKFFGLNGVGVLVKHKDTHITPQMSGGASTTIYRSGTPTLGLTVSIVPALEDALTDLSEHMETTQKWNTILRQKFSEYPSVRINSPSHAIPHILNISVDGIKGYEMQRYLDEKGICVSVKSACSSDYLPSHAVMAVTKDRRRSLESFRISLSHQTTQEDIDALLAAFASIMQERSSDDQTTDTVTAD